MNEGYINNMFIENIFQFTLGVFLRHPLHIFFLGVGCDGIVRVCSQRDCILYLGGYQYCGEFRRVSGRLSLYVKDAILYVGGELPRV